MELTKVVKASKVFLTYHLILSFYFIVPSYSENRFFPLLAITSLYQANDFFL